MKPPMKLMNSAVPFAVLVLLATGCGSETLFKANRKSLEASLTALESDPASALRQAESVVIRTGEDAGAYPLQRFFAAYLAAEAHLAAAERGAFLPDSANRKTSGIRLGESAAAPGVEGGALPHLVAAMYHASLGLEWLPRAEKARTSEKGEALLPETLEAFGAEQAGIALFLSQIAVFAHLRFQGKVDRYLREPDHAALLDFATCKGLAERAHLRPWLRAWLDYAIYDYLRQDNALAAYKFAIGAIALEEEAKGGFPRKLADQMERFVVANADLEWICPTCTTPSPPSLSRCITCNKVETVDFTARKRTRP